MTIALSILKLCCLRVTVAYACLRLRIKQMNVTLLQAQTDDLPYFDSIAWIAAAAHLDSARRFDEHEQIRTDQLDLDDLRACVDTSAVWRNEFHRLSPDARHDRTHLTPWCRALQTNRNTGASQRELALLDKQFSQEKI